MHLAPISLAVFITLLMIFEDDSQEEIQSYYCDMITLYSTTNGKAGWPAYKGTELCTDN